MKQDQFQSILLHKTAAASAGGSPALHFSRWEHQRAREARVEDVGEVDDRPQDAGGEVQ